MARALECEQNSWDNVLQQYKGYKQAKAASRFLERLGPIFKVSRETLTNSEFLDPETTEAFLAAGRNADWRVLLAPKYQKAVGNALVDVRDPQFGLGALRSWTDMELLLEPSTEEAMRSFVLYHYENTKKAQTGAYQQKAASQTLDEEWKSGLRTLMNLSRNTTLRNQRVVFV